MKKFKTVRDLKVDNKKVIMRVDFNVTLEGREIADDTRIKQAIPTIEYLLNRNASIILITHLGRPKGKRSKELTVKPIAKRLERFINKPVLVIDNFLKKDDFDRLKNLNPGQVAMLENIRFYPEEEINDQQFSKKLSELADFYVNDAFGVDHRVHSSTVGIANHLPKAMGFLLEKEIQMISKITTNPKRPLVAIIGGAKAETKITLIDRLLETADQLLIGGGVANTFFKAWGLEVGKSFVSYEMVELARRLIWKASQSNTAMVLPQDLVIGNLKMDKIVSVVPKEKIPVNGKALDIGPHTQADFGSIITMAKTIVWNGPMGVYEKPKFRIGTDFVYHTIAANHDSLSIVGGGDTLAALNNMQLIDEIDHISTGGGAMLEFIEKGTLPAIEALQE